jgi:hypothetical protein
MQLQGLRLPTGLASHVLLQRHSSLLSRCLLCYMLLHCAGWFAAAAAAGLVHMMLRVLCRIVTMLTVNGQLLTGLHSLMAAAAAATAQSSSSRSSSSSRAQNDCKWGSLPLRSVADDCVLIGDYVWFCWN